MTKSISDIKQYLFNQNIKIRTNLNDNELISGLGSLKNSKSNELTFYSLNGDLSLLNTTSARACLID